MKKPKKEVKLGNNLKKEIENPKNQAALEFIMTYGWAILVVLVAIGALAYFGVLSPDRFLPAKCILQSGIMCVDHKVTPTIITVRITNSLGYDISSITMKAGGCGTDTTPAALANGESGTYDITCAEICGVLHSKMRNFIVVESQEKYEQFLKSLYESNQTKQ